MFFFYVFQKPLVISQSVMFLPYVFQSTLVNLQIEEKILSDYQRHFLHDEGFSKPPPKLVPNLCNKANYIIHYQNLKLHLELGQRLTNVYRVLSFDQSP